MVRIRQTCLAKALRRCTGRHLVASVTSLEPARQQGQFRLLPAKWYSRDRAPKECPHAVMVALLCCGCVSSRQLSAGRNPSAHADMGSMEMGHSSSADGTVRASSRETFFPWSRATKRVFLSSPRAFLSSPRARFWGLSMVQWRWRACSG